MTYSDDMKVTQKKVRKFKLIFYMNKLYKCNNFVFLKKLNESLNTSLNTSMKSKRKRNYFEDFTVNILGDNSDKEPGDTDNDKRSRYTEADIA